MFRLMQHSIPKQSWLYEQYNFTALGSLGIAIASRGQPKIKMNSIEVTWKWNFKRTCVVI